MVPLEIPITSHALVSACQVLTSVAAHAISSLPFGAPVGALLGAVFSRAAQVRMTV